MSRAWRRFGGHTSIWTCAAVVLCSLLPALCWAETKGPAVVDCRYQLVDPIEVNRYHHVWLPDDGLFRPLLADVKEPRITGSFQKMTFGNDALPSGGAKTIVAGLVSIGGGLGLWSYRTANGCNGIQVGLAGGVSSQFNLVAPSQDLMNADYLVGVPLTFRRGWLSGRLRVFHQSSHLGDDFLFSHPSFVTADLGFEVVDLILAVGGRWWSLYGGGGLGIHSTVPVKHEMLQAGMEARTIERWLRVNDTLRMDLVAGLDVRSAAARDWGLSYSAKAGFETSSMLETHLVRALIVALGGYFPFGQYFDRATAWTFGLEAQIEL